MARDVKIKIGAEDAASRVFNKLKLSIKNLDVSLLNLGTKSLKVASASIVAFGAAAAAGLGVAIKSASDAEETFGKFNVVFGESADAMKEWSNTTARAMGVSRQEMARMLSGLQDLFVPMGVAEKEAAAMSQTLSKLAIDLGSFNNLETDRVMTDLMAAMTGSGETMKKYGVIVDEAAVKQELLNMKLDPKAASNAEKATARLNIILRGTTAAQGDAIRTSDSFANTLKGLKADFTNLLDVIGKPFLAGLAELGRSFKGTMQGMSDSIAAADWEGAVNIAFLKIKLEVVKGLDETGALIKNYGGGVFKNSLISSLTGGGLIESASGQLAASVGKTFLTGFDNVAEQLQKKLDDAIRNAAGNLVKQNSEAERAGKAMGIAIGEGLQSGLHLSTSEWMQSIFEQIKGEAKTKRPIRKYKPTRRETLIELGFDPDLVDAPGQGKITGRQEVHPKKREPFDGILQATQGRLLTGAGATDPQLAELKKQNAKLAQIDTDLKNNNDLQQQQIDGEKSRPHFQMERIA